VKKGSDFSWKSTVEQILKFCYFGGHRITIQGSPLCQKRMKQKFPKKTLMTDYPTER
jgi:hypothetical protein